MLIKTIIVCLLFICHALGNDMEDLVLVKFGVCALAGHSRAAPVINRWTSCSLC